MSWNGLDDFLTRVSDRLDPPHGEGRLTEYGDLDFLTPEELAVIRPAAVLFGVIPRKSGPTALLTLRPDTMANHAGQVAFPGGKIDPIDVDEVAAAPNAMMAAEMAVIRLTHVADLPSPEELVRKLQNSTPPPAPGPVGGGGGGAAGSPGDRHPRQEALPVDHAQGRRPLHAAP